MSLFWIFLLSAGLVLPFQLSSLETTALTAGCTMLDRDGYELVIADIAID